MRPRILSIAFSLVLGSSPIALAELDYDLPDSLQIASIGLRPAGASVVPPPMAGDDTNHLAALPSLLAPKSDPDPSLTYSMTPKRQTGESERNQPSLVKQLRLSELLRNPPPQGWRIGGAGVLSYFAPKQHWQVVFGYTPDLDTLRGNFDRLHPFSLVWQYSFGKHKTGS